MGHRAVVSAPEGNFLTPRGEYRVRALHVGPRNEGMAWRIQRLRWTRYPLVPYPNPLSEASEDRTTTHGWNVGGHGSCYRPYSADEGGGVITIVKIIITAAMLPVVWYGTPWLLDPHRRSTKAQRPGVLSHIRVGPNRASQSQIE